MAPPDRTRRGRDHPLKTELTDRQESRKSMTTISPPASTFRVSVRSGTLAIGSLDEVVTLSEAREQLAQTRRAYPDSALQTFLPTTDTRLGSWQDASDDDLDHIADTQAALVLAAILQQNMPRITWTLDVHLPGQLFGRADTREQVEEYALMLGVVVEEEGTTYRTAVASGVFDGVKVQVSCYVRDEQPAEVTA